MARLIWLCLLALVLAAQGWEKTSVPADFVMPKPLQFEKSIASVKARPGFLVELVASEPATMDPVNIDFGPDGKLWVVEMADYPLGMDGKGKAGGRVRFLEDRDQDGKFETSTLFLENLNFPTGVKVWRNGVLVIVCPEILFARDTDGDGKADQVETLFRGFKEGNQQHRVNGLVWGLDNWLHVANGDSGGTIESLKTGEKLALGSYDLKIRPDTGEMKLTSGRTQYGRVRDDFGNWFGNNNAKPLWHYVLRKETMDLNPHVVFADRIHHVSRPSVAPRIYPPGKPAYRFNNPHSASHITSACGISIMRDRKLGAEVYGNAFICEPVHNLVHRQVLVPNGITFDGKRAEGEEKSEFLAATDQWFRPVCSVTGPDGSLWVVDMHRYVIEHPEWIPEPWEKVIDLRAGEDKGRIYRVSKQEGENKGDWSRLGGLSTSDLLRKLFSRNGWERDMAHQLLLWKKEELSADGVAKWWTEDSDPLGKIHILSLLEGKGGVPSVLLFDALAGETSPHLQRFALRLINEGNANPAVVGEVVRLSTSEDPGVRFEAIICLGKLKSDEAGEALKIVASKFADSKFDRAALATTLPNHLASVAEVATASLVIPILDTAIGTGNHSAITRIQGENLFVSLLKVLDRRRTSFDKFLQASPPEFQAELKKELGRLDAIRTPEIKAGEILLLGREPDKRKTDIDLLLSLLKPGTELAVSRAAVERLGTLGNFRFLERWNEVSPGVKSVMIENGIRHTTGAKVFFDQIDRGNIVASAVSVAARDNLLKHWDKGIKARAELVFGKTNSNRGAVVSSFAKSLDLKGNAEKGKVTFGQLCANCHQFDGKGIAVGADLSALSDTAAESLLIAIIDPNRAVEDKYQLQLVTLADDGGQLTGMIISESNGGISLLTLDGKTTEIPRNRITSLENTGRSAMPEGLEAVLNPQSMADLIAYIQSKK